MEEEINKTKKKPWMPTSKRFVCFLDIMGFKDMVRRNSHDHIYDLLTNLSKYRDTLEDANLPEPYDSDSLKTVSFSDSIAVFTKDDSVRCFEIMTVAVSWLFAKAIEDGIPIKGAISLGEMSVNINRQIFFGQPLIDAYLLEEDVFYYGMVIHHTVEKYINNTDTIGNIMNYYFDCLTFFKSGQINHLNLNWMMQLDDKKNDIVDFNEIALSLMKKQRENTSGKPRKYIDNTIKMIELSTTPNNV